MCPFKLERHYSFFHRKSERNRIVQGFKVDKIPAMQFIQHLPRSLVFIVLILAATASGADSVKVTEPWAMPLPAVSVNGAAYLTLTNHGSEPVTLVDAASTIANRAQIHGHTEQDGQIKMVHLEEVEIPPHQTQEFTPGGLHIMLMGLKSPLTEGEDFSLTLTFKTGQMVEITVPVTEKMSGMDGDSSHSH